MAVEYSGLVLNAGVTRYSDLVGWHDVDPGRDSYVFEFGLQAKGGFMLSVELEASWALCRARGLKHYKAVQRHRLSEVDTNTTCN